MDKGLHLPSWVPEDAGVPSTPDETIALEMRAKGFLPPFCGISGAVQTELQLPQDPLAVNGILFGEFDVNIALNLGVEARPPDIVDHQHPPVSALCVSRCMAHNESGSFQWRCGITERIVASDVELSPHQSRSIVNILGVSSVDIHPSYTNEFAASGYLVAARYLIVSAELGKLFHLHCSRCMNEFGNKVLIADIVPGCLIAALV